MAGAHVQLLGTGLDLVGSSSPLAFNLTNKPTAGNAIVLRCCLYNSSARTFTGSSCTDNCSPPNTYVLHGVTSQVPGSNGVAFATYLCDNAQNIPAGTMTITVTPAGFQLSSYGAHEFSGLLSSGAFDNDGVSTGSATTSTTTASVTPVASTTTAIAFCGLDSGDTNININLPAGWTNVEVNQNATTDFGFRLCYKNVTGTSAISETFTHDSANTATWLMTLKEAAGGGGNVLMGQCCT